VSDKTTSVSFASSPGESGFEIFLIPESADLAGKIWSENTFKITKSVPLGAKSAHR